MRPIRASLSMCAAAIWMGCGASVAAPEDDAERGCLIGTPGCVPLPMSADGSAGKAASSGTGSGQTGALQPGQAPGSGSGSGAPADVANDVPCEVAQVVSGHCTQCHAEQPKFGAMMPLTKLADFHAPAKSNPARKVFEIVPERINAQDATRRMPPASSTALAANDLRTLNDWVTAGALASTTGTQCALPPAGGPTPSAGVGMPIDYNDPEMKCYSFLAHAPGDKLQPHSVETTPNMYKGFTFMPPWKGMMYARSFKSIIDNGEVIHHWLFFKNSAPGTDGEIADQSGAHPDGNLVHGWAPGGEDLYMEPDVGEEMPGDVSYMLEAHYNNTTGAAAPDSSGVEVCVTPKVPAKVASISWLGTDLILGNTAEGTCEPLSDQPITIIGGTPHMHLKGRHMKVVITRADGTEEIMTDKPFDFEYQVSYRFNKVLMPGDTVTTTCTFSEPATYGRGTNDEMCYLFTLYYPKLALTNGNPLGTSLHGPDTCLPITPGGSGAGLLPGLDISGFGLPGF